MSGPDERQRPSPAVQDYLKAVYRVTEDTGRTAVTTSEVAARLAVTPPSASAMLKRLVQLEYLKIAGKRGAFELTETGRYAALEVIRHHRLLETYLVTRLGVPWDKVHVEAEILEHHLSEELEARIAEALGHPDRDPHGDPIPTVDGEVSTVHSASLADLSPGDKAVVRRVGHRDGELLRYLASKGLVPDAPIEVVRRGSFGGPLRVRVGDRRAVDVPPDAARAVWVSAQPG